MDGLGVELNLSRLGVVQVSLTGKCLSKKAKTLCIGVILVPDWFELI